MSADLDSADLPDTPYQGAVVEAAETRPPLAAAGRPAACFVRRLWWAQRLPGNMWGCVSVIGLCPTPPASLSGVVGCVVALHASHCPQAVCDALRVVIEERSILLVARCICILYKGCKMSQRRRSESVKSSSSSDYHWDGLPSPMSCANTANQSGTRSRGPRLSSAGMLDHTEAWGYPIGVPRLVAGPPRPFAA